MVQKSLNEKQQSVISIATFTANGDIARLNSALNEGLNSGLTINEIKEILIQMYVYAGFPRSLNALSALMAVNQARRQRGIEDKTGKPATPPPEGWNSLGAGSINQARLVGQPVTGAVFEFAPAIDQFLKAHLFGDIFQRDVLDWRTRELATISALAAMQGVNSQLESHYTISLNNGLTAEQLWDFTNILAIKCESATADNAREVLRQLLVKLNREIPSEYTKTGNTMSEPFVGNGIFPKGLKNEAYAQYFQGTSYLNMLSTTGVTIGNVVFEPGCRNNWHIHHNGGQILLITGGRGWYQEWDRPARSLIAGDVVNIPPGTKHWHGAAKDSWFAHIAVEVPADGSSNEWLEPVGNEEYNLLA